MNWQNGPEGQFTDEQLANAEQIVHDTNQKRVWKGDQPLALGETEEERVRRVLGKK